jgi:hypothetical protein
MVQKKSFTITTVKLQILRDAFKVEKQSADIWSENSKVVYLADGHQKFIPKSCIDVYSLHYGQSQQNSE